MNVLVIGAGGYIGAAVSEHLGAAGHRVIGDSSRSRARARRGIPAILVGLAAQHGGAPALAAATGRAAGIDGAVRALPPDVARRRFGGPFADALAPRPGGLRDPRPAPARLEPVWGQRRSP